jgi:hypothetical protein
LIFEKHLNKLCVKLKKISCQTQQHVLHIFLLEGSSQHFLVLLTRNNPNIGGAGGGGLNLCKKRVKILYIDGAMLPGGGGGGEGVAEPLVKKLDKNCEGMDKNPAFTPKYAEK